MESRKDICSDIFATVRPMLDTLSHNGNEEVSSSFYAIFRNLYVLYCIMLA